MSASISMKKKTVGMDYLRRTTGIITGATGAYISEVMPVTTSTLSEAKNTVSSVSAAFANTSQSVLPKIRQLKTQVTFRGINNWFMGKEDDYSDFGVNDSNLSFDINTDPADIAEAQVSELGRNANQISQAVVESSHKMVESQLAATANLMNTAEKQTAVITAGFDKTNETLNKILEVLTKNTSTLIETTVANSKRSANDEMAGNGKFNLSEYKKIISGNFKNSQLGTMATLIPAMMGDKEMIKQFLSPESVTQMLIGAVVNKKSPNLKKNMKALDDAINETVMTSLIRLGENDSYGLKGQIAKMFGIDSKRKETNTSRSTLELKTVPFDSIAHESLTNAIPGYLRKILVAVGGPDEVYDYRSRSFRTKTSIRQDFRDTAASKGNLYGASGKVRDAMGTDQFSNMVYDMMMTELGSRTSGGAARRTVDSFGNQKDTKSYLLNTVLKGVNLTREEQNAINQFTKKLGNASSGMGGIDIMNQVARNNVNRNTRMSQYVDGANAYNVDLSDIRDSVGSDLKNIAESYGKKRKSDDNASSSVRSKGNKSNELSGLNYTNIALFEIYRKLNKGINVFQVGSNQRQSDPFVNYGGKYLQKPQNYRTKPMMDNTSTRESLVSRVTGGADLSGEANLLRNQQLEDGTTEELTKGQRFARWGKNRGGNLARALFSGSPEQVKDAFTLMFRDVGQVAGDGVKRGAAKLNESSGNFSGYLKHKITGAGYKYKDEDGNDVVIDKNDKGGVLGYFDELIFGDGGAKGLIKRTSSMGSKWFKSVAGYFNYGSKDPDEQRVAGKRKTILGTSVGAMLGMGLLGGPLGIVMGGIAGSAISQTDGLGAKLKNILFGDKDHEGDKKKDRNKRRGLIGRAVDGIVDPIRFQIGKTMTTFGSVLKKNILGPMSNIGAAIKERMSNAAGGVVSKVFGGIFKGATGMLKKLIMIPLNIAKVPINAIGGLTRGAAEGGGAVAGGFLNSIAKGIAGRNGRSVINERIAGQKNDARSDKAASGYFGRYVHEVERDENGNILYENGQPKMKMKLDAKGRPIKAKRKGFSGDYKDWKEEQDAARDRRGSIDDYTAERKLTKEEIEAAEAAKRTAESTSEIAEGNKEFQSKVSGEIIPGSSFKSHDAGVHERLDKIIDLFDHGGNVIHNDTTDMNKPNMTSKIKDAKTNDPFITGALSAAASFASSGDVVNDDESRKVTGIIDDASSPNANKQRVSSKLKDLMGIQKRKSDDSNEKKDEKQGFLSKIFDMVSGGFGSLTNKFGLIATGLAGLLGIEEVKSFWNDVVKGDMNFSEWWGTESMIGKGVKGLMDVSGFIGSVGGPIVNTISGGIATLTKMIPFMPTITPPQINTTGPFAGLATGVLGGLYLKGASALGSIASAAASLISAGSNALGKGSGLGKYAGLAGGALAIGGSVVGWSQGGYKHDQTDAAGNEIIDQTQQGAYDSTSLKYIGHSTMGTINPVSGKSSLTGANFNPNGGSVFSAATPSASAATTMTSATGKTINKVDDVWRYADTGKKVSASNLAKAIPTPPASTVANAADSKGALGFVKKALEGIKNFLMKNKAVKAFADTVGKKIDDLISSITRGGQKIFQKAANKVVSIITRGTIKEASGAATLGIGYAVMAFGGALSGGLSAANIFGVRESDVNGIMRTVASVVVAMLNGVPGLWALELADLVLQPLLGITVRSFTCELLYGLLGGKEDLAQKQETFGGDLSSYNEQYGAQLSTDEYNDLTNKGMFAKMFGRGSVKTDENGRAMFDDAGEALRTNHGVAGWFAGGEKEYAKDENGAVLKDADGKAIQATDKEGHVVKKNMTWTDHVGNWFHDVGGFFGGKTTYKTDENGRAIIGDDGKAVVENKEGNIFQRGGATISNWWNGQEVVGPDGKTTKTEGFADAAKKTLGGIGSVISQPFKDVGSAISSWFKGNEELDENGKPISDENGKSVKKGKMSDYIKQSLGKITSSIMGPVKEMSKGVSDWVSKEAPWLADGVKNAADWIGSKASSIWDKLTGKDKKNQYGGTTSYATSFQKPSYYGRGGPVTEPHSATESAPVQTSTAPTVSKEGGNPVNLPTKVTSGFGYRDLGAGVEFHKGIDLVPTASGDPVIGARFAGTIADVKSNIPNSHTGLGVSSNQMGNFIKLDTPQGKRITYMHLAANSIPNGIKKGSKIAVGDKLGVMGTTGRSTGRHLHYQFNDISSGNPIDPTSSVFSGSQMSSFNGVTDSSQGAEGFPDAYVDTSQSVSETGESSNGLSVFLDKIKTLGMNFLSFITGGLISSTSQESGSQEISYDQNGMSTGTTGNMGLVDGPVELLSTREVAGIQTKREKKEVIDLATGKSFFVSWAASSGYHSDWTPWTQDDVKTIWSLLHPNGGGNINNKDDWSWNARPGVLKLNGHMVACGFHLRPHAAIMGGNPGAPFSNQSNTKPASGWPLGGHMCMYYGDSPGGTPKCNDAAKEAYVLGNKFFQAQASNLNSSSVSTSGGTPVVSAGEQGIWQYLKSKGYTDAATAGIMGCWANESNNRSDRVEGDYLGSYPGFSNVMSSQQSLDNYTTGKLFPAYARSGNSINKEAYKGEDGHYYPGVGLAQWTGPRGYNLFQYAKSRGMDWRQTNGQLEFFSKEMTDRKLSSPLNSQGSASSAADFFCRKYEGYNQSSGISKRQASANQLYNKYKGMAGPQQISPMLASANSASAGSVPAVGGPVDEANLGPNNYTTNVQTPKIRPKSTSIIQKLSSSFRTDPSTTVLDNYSETDTQTVDDGPIGHIESLLIQVVNELRSISTNTGTSSSLLDSLNGKDFVDKGLRDSITAVGKNQKKQVNRHMAGNNNNVRTVTAMARP